ncbi:MAG TPA: hypothetical protein VGK73_15675 [Polyangiaceae bacterium]
MANDHADDHAASPGAAHETAIAGSSGALADARWAESFGSGSRRELEARLADALSRAPSPAGDARVALVAELERAHHARYGSRALAAEANDERERDRAAAGDAALVRYEGKWARRLDKLLRAHPERWRLYGISDEELRDELTLRLIDALRSKAALFARDERAGKEWGLCFLARERHALRAGFRLNVVLADPTPVLDRAPDEEERFLALESDALVALARERAERSLNRPQRRWLAALKLSANAGGFFETSGRLNLSAASRLLDKHRSSALRAFSELQRHFGRELERLESDSGP